MRYVLLKPAHPSDPRRHNFASQDGLLGAFPAVLETETEGSMVSAVRNMYPDAVAMPVPFTIGSGEVFLLGLVDSVHSAMPAASAQDPGEVFIPFVVLVQAAAERESDRRIIKKRGQFNRALWRVPAQRPEVYRHVKAEVRTDELDNPAIVTAEVGPDKQDRDIIYCEVFGVPMSIILPKGTLNRLGE